MALVELEKNKLDAAQNHALALLSANTPKGTSSGTAIKKDVVDDVAAGFKVMESYGTAANDIMSLAKAGDVELNPSGFRKAQPFTSFTQGDQAALEDAYGKNGAAIIHRIKNVVQENPVVGEHSDADREAAIKTIIGEGDPAKIAARLNNRAQVAAKQVQIKSQALSTKDQEKLSGRVNAPNLNPTLAPPAPRQR